MPQAELIEAFFQIRLNEPTTETEVREFLREKSSDPDFQSFINAILPRMVDDNYQEIVQALVDAGADVNAPNRYGATSIYFAVRTGNRQMIRLLLAKGAKLDVCGDSGETLADVASFFGHDDLADELVKLGVPKSSVNPLSR